jgi:hypothetical protein
VYSASRAAITVWSSAGSVKVIGAPGIAAVTALLGPCGSAAAEDL